MAYLAKHPAARVLVLTDDAPFLEFATALLTRANVAHAFTHALRGRDRCVSVRDALLPRIGVRWDLC